MRTEVTKMKKSQKAFKKAPAPGQIEFDPLPRSKGNFRALTLLPISDNLLNHHNSPPQTLRASLHLVRFSN